MFLVLSRIFILMGVDGAFGGGGVLSYKRLMGMCFWMGLRFPFSVELG